MFLLDRNNFLFGMLTCGTARYILALGVRKILVVHRQIYGKIQTMDNYRLTVTTVNKDIKFNFPVRRQNLVDLKLPELRET